jgi:N6-adenosine-specific RNA methylase IME4
MNTVPLQQSCDIHALAASGRRFGCIYVDPPWLYDNQATRAAAGNHYTGLTVAQLCELPVRELAADDAHLHLWVTNAFLFEAPKLFDAWGFEFRSMLVWVKPQMGLGNYWWNSHEIMMTAVRDDSVFNDNSFESVLKCKRGAHSAKPEQVRHMIERVSNGPFLEMFGRRAVPGWTVWGDQVEHDLLSGGPPDDLMLRQFPAAVEQRA